MSDVAVRYLSEETRFFDAVEHAIAAAGLENIKNYLTQHHPQFAGPTPPNAILTLASTSVCKRLSCPCERSFGTDQANALASGGRFSSYLQTRVFVSVLSIGEISKGIAGLPMSDKRAELEDWAGQRNLAVVWGPRVAR